MSSETRCSAPDSIMLPEDFDDEGHQAFDVETPRQSIVIRIPGSFDVQARKTLQRQSVRA